MTKFGIYLFGYDAAQTVGTRTFNGEHWYIAQDICRLLGIANHSQAVKMYLNKHESQLNTQYAGGRRKKHYLWINTTGMLKLIKVAKSDRARSIRERAKNTPYYLRPALWPAELDMAA